MKYAKRAASAALLFSSGFSFLFASFLFAFLLKRKEKEGRYLFLVLGAARAIGASTG